MQTSLTKIFNTYIQDIYDQYQTNSATEHSYRLALAHLISSLLPELLVTNEASISAADRPDLTIWKKLRSVEIAGQTQLFKPIPIGFVEHKSIGVDLNKKENQQQLNRYLNLGNVAHTDGLRFRFYINHEKTADIEIAKITDDGRLKVLTEQFETLSYWFHKIVEQPVPTVRTPKALAELMADRAKPIRWTIQNELEKDIKEGNHSTQLYNQFSAFKKDLIHGLTAASFADLYAQTIAYGLFAARYHDDTSDDFSRQEAAAKLPATNPFLQNFFREVAGYETEGRITWVLDNFANLFNYCDVHMLMAQYGNSSALNNDPVIHFYETFLSEYDPKLRELRGVYYTPQPVVNFIVRAVDEVLQDEFGLVDGLADKEKITLRQETGQSIEVRRNTNIVKTTKRDTEFRKVQILDPATGTGTFLNEAIKIIYSKFKGQEGAWPEYVEKELLPSLHGFELLMAAYAMAHMKLGITLSDTGYTHTGNSRLGIYLTNSLEEADVKDEQLNLFGMSQALTNEAIGASRVKNDLPIMIVMGNPPYSIKSSNLNTEQRAMVEKYKYINGVRIKEKGALQLEKNINDDYVKFLAYAEKLIEKSGEGVLGFITNNNYLDARTLRGLRWNLAKTFDKMYILNLHGSAKRKEIAPDGTRDENVFQIEQGVSIIIAYKKSSLRRKLGDVYVSELLGLKEKKYAALSNASLKTIEWKQVDLTEEDRYDFVATTDPVIKKQYRKGIPVNELFPVMSSGIVTARDKLTIDISADDMWKRVNDFAFLEPEVARSKYNLGDDSTTWKVTKAIADIKSSGLDKSLLRKINYRPFDVRYTYYTGNVVGFYTNPRRPVMQHFLVDNDNVGLMVSKHQKTHGFSHALVHNQIVESGYVSNRTSEIGSSFPLYLYLDDNGELGRRANIEHESCAKLLSNIGDYSWVDDHKLKVPGDTAAVSPLDILDYVYAQLFSPVYRNNYVHLLKRDFPVIPLPKSKKIFWALVEKGGKLRDLHLFKEKLAKPYATTYPIDGNNMIDLVRFEASKVWINDTQYFGGVSSEAWELCFGAYRPAQKWLAYRKGRSLNGSDIEHYQQIIDVMNRTYRIVQEIGTLSPE